MIAQVIDSIIDKSITWAIVAAWFLFVWLISKRNKALGDKIFLVSGIVAGTFVALVLILVIVMLINSKLHFWF